MNSEKSTEVDFETFGTNEILKRTNYYIGYVQRLVQGGLLGYNKHTMLYTYVNVEWKKYKEQILLNLKKYSGLGCNNYQSLILPFLQVDRKFWIQFFNNNDCTCINFLFVWLCVEKHDKIFVNSAKSPINKTNVQAFLFSLSTIVEAFN